MYRVETRVEESDKDYVNAVAFESKEEAEEARRTLSLTPGSHKVVGKDDGNSSNADQSPSTTKRSDTNTTTKKRTSRKGGK